MKNQNDLIVGIVCGVLALGVLAFAFFTRPEPVRPPAPTPVPVGEPTVQPGAVVFANALPKGDNNQQNQFGAPGAAAPGGGGGAVGGPQRAGVSQN